MVVGSLQRTQENGRRDEQVADGDAYSDRLEPEQGVLVVKRTDDCLPPGQAEGDERTARQKRRNGAVDQQPYKTQVRLRYMSSSYGATHSSCERPAASTSAAMHHKVEHLCSGRVPSVFSICQARVHLIHARGHQPSTTRRLLLELGAGAAVRVPLLLLKVSRHGPVSSWGAMMDILSDNVPADTNQGLSITMYLFNDNHQRWEKRPRTRPASHLTASGESRLQSTSWARTGIGRHLTDREETSCSRLEFAAEATRTT